MRSLSKIITVFVSVSLLVSTGAFQSPLSLNIASASSCSGLANSWILQWSDGNAVSSGDFQVAPPKLSVLPGDSAFSTSTDPGTIDATLNPSTWTFTVASSSPEYGKGNTLQWTCQTTGSSTGVSSSQQPQGTEACLAAAQIAAKYGAYTAMNSSFSTLAQNIQQQVTQRVIANLQSQFSNIHINLTDIIGTSTFLTGLLGNNPTFSDLQSLFTSSGLQQAFINTFGNPLKQQVQNQMDQITKEASQQLAQVGISILGDTAKQMGSILQLGGVVQSVPVNDQNTQEQLKVVQQLQEKAIQEQKTQEIIDQTRSQCNLLLKQTVETIKRSLLYQFTSQTVDWIQGGGIQFSNGKIVVNPPQYFSQPWKSLADAGLTAVDRLISQVAPQLCQPFRLAVTADIPTVDRQSNPFYEQTSCTLNQVVGNIQDFYNNFRSGGWLGYQEIWMPQNNYYGASLQLQSMVQDTANNVQSAVQNEMSQGNGYRNKYICTQWNEFAKVPTNMAAVYAASGIPQGKNIELVSGTYYEGSPVDTSDGMPSDAQANIKDSAYISGGRVFSDANNTMFYECVNSQITQPGNIAAGLAAQTSQVDVQSLINAQDLTDIGDIIQRAIINKLTKVGINGFQGLLQQLPGIQSRLQILNP